MMFKQLQLLSLLGFAYCPTTVASSEAEIKIYPGFKAVVDKQTSIEASVAQLLIDVCSDPQFGTEYTACSSNPIVCSAQSDRDQAKALIPLVGPVCLQISSSGKLPTQTLEPKTSEGTSNSRTTTAPSSFSTVAVTSISTRGHSWTNTAATGCAFLALLLL
ncbi:hypothetical protein BDR26DRAFT_879612 [Obelidium mucronatum]|nr:hypothetical protein BDR26DRAFT_879612 [Obelidium mucronatum]